MGLSRSERLVLVLLAAVVLVGRVVRHVQDRAQPLAVERDSLAVELAIDSTAAGPTDTTGPQAERPAPGPIDINSAPLEEIIQLPGIGPTKAKSIIDTRARIGRFAHVRDLLRVPGIGPKTLDRIEALVTAGGVDTTSRVVTSADTSAGAPRSTHSGRAE